MSKRLIGFKLKDLYAIKHALEERLKDDTRPDSDILHETALLSKIEREIAHFNLFIGRKGKVVYYD